MTGHGGDAYREQWRRHGNGNYGAGGMGACGNNGISSGISEIGGRGGGGSSGDGGWSPFLIFLKQSLKRENTHFFLK